MAIGFKSCWRSFKPRYSRCEEGKPQKFNSHALALDEYDALSMEISLKRIFDLLLVLISFAVVLIPIVLISLAISITSRGGVLHWSSRIGKNNKIFDMPKFRSMNINAPVVATHLLESPEHYLTPIGAFLRKSSLDELPQLWSILVADMSFVGPRPALFNQDDLIKLRTDCGVHELVPGLTGWAQINGRDELSISEKVLLDKYYLDNKSLLLDLRIMVATLFKVVRKDGIAH